MFSNIDNSKLTGTNYFVNRLVQSVNVWFSVSPLETLFRDKNGNLDVNTFKTSIQQAYTWEASHLPSRSGDATRQAVHSLQGVPILEVGVLDDREYMRPDATNSPIVEILRLRAPIGLIIKVVSYYIASSQPAAFSFKQRISQDALIPRVLLENFRRIRRSQCGTHYITPTIDFVRFDEYLKLVPSLKNTFFDPVYLTSEDGISDFINFLSVLEGYNQNQCYFSSVKASEIKNISFESGEQTTFCSLISDLDTNSVQILQHNSYAQSSAPEVHVVDALICTAKLRDDKSFVEVRPTFSPKYMLTQNRATDAAIYMTKRGLGIIPNSTPLDEENKEDMQSKTSDTPKSKKATKKTREKINRIDSLDQNFFGSFNSMQATTALKYLSLIVRLFEVIPQSKLRRLFA